MKKQERVEKYKEYLTTEHWRKIRELKAVEQNYTCEMCKKVMNKGFHIHHLTYVHKGRERLDELMFLCPECHKEWHKHNKVKKYPKEKCRRCANSYIVRNLTNNTLSTCLMCSYHNKKCDPNYVCESYVAGELKQANFKTKIKSKRSNKKKTRLLI